MAQNSHHAEAPHPAAVVDDEHRNTYKAFIAGTKWSIVGIIVIASLLAIFRTHNGM